MSKYKQIILDEIDKIHFDYAECKIEEKEFMEKLRKLSLSEEDIYIQYLDACDARYEYKKDNESKN